MEDFDRITAGETAPALFFRLINDPAAAFCVQSFSVLFREPVGDIPRIYLHLEQVQILITVHTVLFRILNPLQHGLGLLVEA